MTDRYTIRELADAKGTSAPVRAALLAMDEELRQLREAKWVVKHTDTMNTLGQAGNGN